LLLPHCPSAAAAAAVLGFMFAITREFGTGESVYAQLVSGGLASALLVIAGVTLASFAPALLRQVRLCACR
jgi:tetrahydromethanopterin S-methyltransferase subunit C